MAAVGLRPLALASIWWTTIGRCVEVVVDISVVTVASLHRIKALQATAAVLGSSEAGWRHNAVVAGASAPPAAVAQLDSLDRLFMHLVMFDIDGTLTETMKVDEECFVRTFMDVFGVSDIDTDWSHYRHTTDSGIFHDVYSSRTGRPPTAQDVSRFRQHFVRLPTAACSRNPFASVAGAAQLLSRLSCSSTHRVSLATGGWRDSARLKMTSAGMCFDGHPAASADDALDRESIMKLSLQRATEQYREVFASIVYVGDGVSDARACRALGIPFIGIGSGLRAARLASEGAVRVFQDLSESDLFLESLYDLAQAV